MSEILIPWVGDEYVPWEIKKGAQTYTEEVPYVVRQVIWKPNEPFKASFKPETFPEGYSRVWMINTANDTKIAIRPKEFKEAFYNTAVVFGVFIGEWEIKVTKNRYYGLRLVK